MIRTQSNLLTDAAVIRDETQESANSATRVGTAIFDTVDTVFNTYAIIQKAGNYGLSYKVSGYDISDIQLQVVRWNRKSHCYKFVSGAGIFFNYNDHFMDVDSAKTARPRMNLTTPTGTLDYTTDLNTILTELEKLRTTVYIEQGEGDKTIYFNTEKAGKHFDPSIGSYSGEGYLRSPRYGLALTYKGMIISNIIAVRIGYRPSEAKMNIRNINY